MKATSASLLFGTGLVLFVAMAPVLPQDASKPAPGGQGAPLPATPELRRPGFLFLELGTARIAEYISFFEAVAGYRVIRRETRYASLTSDLGQILLIDPQELPQGHPFHAKLTGSGLGLGVEIGLVVGDLDKAYAAAVQCKDKGWSISMGIARRPWGVRDFRVLAPDGYYVRITEGPKT